MEKVRLTWWLSRELFREGPEWIAWRLKALTVRLNDLKLSPPVRDAWDGRPSS